VLLTIKEMGPGVPEALPAGLFGRFNPSVRSRVGGETSTGLGLFITKPIG
jgi:nitrogen-specific signal transduction histidine kinase